MKVIFLGTSGGIPTLYRNLPSVALINEGNVILFDCGEFTQIQLIKSSIKLGRIDKIFISHLHGDHVTGLPGLLMLLNHASREKPLHIYGPAGLKNYIFSTKKILNFYLGYHIYVNEICAGETINGDGYKIITFPLEHTTFTLGFSYIEDEKPGKLDIDKTRALGVPEGPLLKRLKNGEDIKLEDGRTVFSADVVGPPVEGRKIVYAVDTRPTDSVVENSIGADLLIHDGMFLKDIEDEAAKRGHCTAESAANIAKKAEVKRLILTHISPRYVSGKPLAEEAKAVFENTFVAYDLLEVEIERKKAQLPGK